MSTQRYISTSFWDDEWIMTLDPSEKLLYMYFMTNPLTNIAGVYKIAPRRVSFDTGFMPETVIHIMQKFEKAGKVYRFGEYIVLPSWPKHQKWETKKAIQDGIISCLNALSDDMRENLVSVGYKFDMTLLDHPPIIPPSSPHQPRYSDSDLDTDIDSDSDFNSEQNQKSPDKPAKSTKHKYGSFQNILLTDDEKQRLVEDFHALADMAIQYLSEYKVEKGYVSKSDNLTIRRWVIDAVRKREGLPAIPKQKPPPEVKARKCPKCGGEMRGGGCTVCFSQFDSEGNEI